MGVGHKRPGQKPPRTKAPFAFTKQSNVANAADNPFIYALHIQSKIEPVFVSNVRLAPLIKTVKECASTIVIIKSYFN